MTIKARFDGWCRKCGKKITAGEEVEWVKGDGVYCLPVGQCQKREWDPLAESVVPKGTYTAVFGRHEKVWVTVRVYLPGPNSKFHGKAIFKVKDGHSYTGLGFVDGAEIKLWRNKSGPVVDRALAAWEVVKKDPASAGEVYALEANRCWRCDLQLTVPASIHRGLGPDCAKIIEARGRAA